MHQPCTSQGGYCCVRENGFRGNEPYSNRRGNRRGYRPYYYNNRGFRGRFKNHQSRNCEREQFQHHHHPPPTNYDEDVQPPHQYQPLPMPSVPRLTPESRQSTHSLPQKRPSDRGQPSVDSSTPNETPAQPHTPQIRTSSPLSEPAVRFIWPPERCSPPRNRLCDRRSIIFQDLNLNQFLASAIPLNEKQRAADEESEIANEMKHELRVKKMKFHVTKTSTCVKQEASALNKRFSR